MTTTDRRTAECMPSGLRVNLLNFRTCSGYMVMLDNSAVVRIFIAGKFLSSSINTEDNCWFSILVFSGSVTDSSPSVLNSGDTYHHHCQWRDQELRTYDNLRTFRDGSRWENAHIERKFLKLMAFN